MSSESGTSLSGEHHAGSPDTEYVLDVTPNAWRRDSNLSNYSNATRGQWADYYNVHAQFLPWEHQKMNGFEILKRTSEYFESRPPTSKQVSTNNITDHLGAKTHTGESTNMDDIALLHGWWRGRKSSSGPYYCNPEYPHDHPDDDYLAQATYWDDDAGEYVNERFDLAIRAAKLGLSGPVLAPAFGLECGGGPRDWLAARGFGWEAKVEEGRRTMARTWKTIHDWGHSYTEIGEAFGRHRTTISDRITKLAPDFEPPRDPNYRKVEVVR